MLMVPVSYLGDIWNIYYQISGRSAFTSTQLMQTLYSTQWSLVISHATNERTKPSLTDNMV